MRKQAKKCDKKLQRFHNHKEKRNYIEVVLYAINQVLENKVHFVQTFRKNVVTVLMYGTEYSEYAEEKKTL